MSDVILVLGVLVAAALLAVLVFLAREQRIPHAWLRVLTVACALGLLVMLLSDWPFEFLAAFWADHSVLAGLLSTVLLVALGFLAFEDSEQRRQERLDSSLTAAGLSGVVDHIVDVEVALALLSAKQPPDPGSWGAWDEPEGKPLRWLRHRRERMFTTERDWPSRDPRGRAATLPSHANSDKWRLQLVDQSVRRLSAALRDWSPVIGISRNGRIMLVALASVRKGLMRLAADLDEGRLGDAEALLVELRARCRLMAFFFEKQSGSYPQRPEVIPAFEPLTVPSGSDSALLGTDEAALSRDWREALKNARRDLGAET